MSQKVVDLTQRLKKGNCPLLEKLAFEKELLNKLSGRFADSEEYMYERDFLETSLINNEMPLQANNGTFFSKRGIVAGYYGLIALELSCTGKGYLEFNCCFDNPSIDRCRTHFEKNQFTMIFGKGNSGFSSFERYLRSFMLAGELHKSESEDGKCASLRSFRNLSSWPLIQGYTLKIVEPIIMHSVQDYFKQFNVDC